MLSSDVSAQGCENPNADVPIVRNTRSDQAKSSGGNKSSSECHRSFLLVTALRENVSQGGFKFPISEI